MCLSFISTSSFYYSTPGHLDIKVCTGKGQVRLLFTPALYNFNSTILHAAMNCLPLCSLRSVQLRVRSATGDMAHFLS